MSSDPREFSAPEVCALAGISYRQIDYWCRAGWLQPVTPAVGSGSRRMFDTRGAQMAWLLGQLSGGPGVRIPDVSAIHHVERFAGLAVLIGDRIEVVHDATELLAVLAGARLTVTIINLDTCPIGAPLPEEVPA